MIGPVSCTTAELLVVCCRVERSDVEKDDEAAGTSQASGWRLCGRRLRYSVSVRRWSAGRIPLLCLPTFTAPHSARRGVYCARTRGHLHQRVRLLHRLRHLVWMHSKCMRARVLPRNCIARTELTVYLSLFHRRTRRAYRYNACLAWYNVVLTARSLKREIQTTGAKC